MNDDNDNNKNKSNNNTIQCIPSSKPIANCSSVYSSGIVQTGALSVQSYKNNNSINNEEDYTIAKARIIGSQSVLMMEYRESH